MRISLLAMLIAATGAFCANDAIGQTGTAPSRARRPATKTGYEYYRYAQPAPSVEAPSAPAPYSGEEPAAAPSCEVPAAPSCEAPAASCTEQSCSSDPSCAAEPSCGCEAPACDCGSDCCDWCDLGEPCKLFDCCCLEEKRIVITGWVNGGYTWNPDNPTDNFNGPQTFNDRANEFQMNQAYLYVERATDTECHAFDVGGRVDLLYGTDWRTTPALGLEVNRDLTKNWNQDSRFYGLAMPQAYAQFALNDLTVKAGKWYTPIGYEVVTATGNFFYSHAYTHQYGEPFTHTGVLGSYTVTDNWTVLAGVHRGWDAWEDPNNDPAGIWGVTYTNEDYDLTIAYAANFSNEANQIAFPLTPAQQNRYNQSVVVTKKVNDKLTWVAMSDYGHTDNGVAEGVDAEWYSFVNYLMYKVNDCLSYGVRYEWMRDDDGTRVFGFGAGFADPSMGYKGGGYAGNFNDITVGVNYKPNANLTVRPEARWDWYEGQDGTVALGGTGPRPFDFGTDSKQFTAGVDFIYTY